MKINYKKIFTEVTANESKVSEALTEIESLLNEMTVEGSEQAALERIKGLLSTSENALQANEQVFRDYIEDTRWENIDCTREEVDEAKAEIASLLKEMGDKVGAKAGNTEEFFKWLGSE